MTRLLQALTLLCLFLSSRASANVHRQQAKALVEEPRELPRPPERRARKSSARRAPEEPETRAHRRRRRTTRRQRRADEGGRQAHATVDELPPYELPPGGVPPDRIRRPQVPAATPSSTSTAGTGGGQGVVGLLSMPAVQHVLKFTAERVQQDPKWAAQLRAMQGVLSEPGGMQRMLAQLQRNAGSMAPGPPTLHKPPPAELIRPPAAPLLGGAARWPAGWMGEGKPSWTNAAAPNTAAGGASFPAATAPGGSATTSASSGGGNDPMNEWMSMHMGGAASLQLQHAASAPQPPWMLPQGKPSWTSAATPTNAAAGGASIPVATAPDGGAASSDPVPGEGRRIRAAGMSPTGVYPANQVQLPSVGSSFSDGPSSADTSGKGLSSVMAGAMTKMLPRPSASKSPLGWSSPRGRPGDAAVV